MPATIKYNNNKQEIIDYVISNLRPLMETIREDDTGVTVDEDNDKLVFEFPVDEVYGWTMDYVEAVPAVFSELKQEYPDIAIDGLVYAEDTISAFTMGYYFHCTESEPELIIDSDWQICEMCGKIIVGDTFYNSSQYDFGEGNRHCLCSPTCMLEYIFDEDWHLLETNESCEDEVDLDEIEDDDEEENQLKDLLWQRINDNLDEYLDDFEANKSRIEKLTTKKHIPEDKRHVLLEILNKLK